MIKPALHAILFLFIAVSLVSVVAAEDEDQMDWFKYYFDHYQGYGTTWYYTGLHAPVLDFSGSFKAPTLFGDQNLLKAPRIDPVMSPNNQNTGFLIKSEPTGADVYVNGEYRGKTRTLNSLKVFGLESGINEVVLSYPGYHNYIQNFSLFHNEVLYINVILKPLKTTTG